jgi:hypothetical protein
MKQLSNVFKTIMTFIVLAIAHKSQGPKNREHYKKGLKAEIFSTFFFHLLSFFFLMITILPSKVKLLHFPRSHLRHVTHAIVKSCFFEDTKE